MVRLAAVSCVPSDVQVVAFLSFCRIQVGKRSLGSRGVLRVAWWDLFGSLLEGLFGWCFCWCCSWMLLLLFLAVPCCWILDSRSKDEIQANSHLGRFSDEFQPQLNDSVSRILLGHARTTPGRGSCRFHGDLHVFGVLGRDFRGWLYLLYQAAMVRHCHIRAFPYSTG